MTTFETSSLKHCGFDRTDWIIKLPWANRELVYAEVLVGFNNFQELYWDSKCFSKFSFDSDDFNSSISSLKMVECVH